MTNKVKETIKEVVHELDETIKQKNTKVKELFAQGGKNENGNNKSLKDIENEQVI